MPIGDISTTKQFVNGQLGVDGSDLNAIVGQSSIQTAFYSAQSSGSSPGSSDLLLLLSSGGSFYKILYNNFFNTAQVRAAAGIPQYVATINGDMSVWQRNTTFSAAANNAYTADRFKINYSLTAGSVNVTQTALAGSLVSGNYQPAFALRATVATADASPAAGDFFVIAQRVELRQARKLFGAATSMQVWVRSSVAGTFAFGIRNANSSQHYKQDFNVGTPNTWQQLTLPNIAAMPTGSGTWGTAETDFSYEIFVTLLAGSTFQSSDQSAWTAGNTLGSSAQTNLFATLSATFDICLLQHESGPVCTAFLPDDDFSETLFKCRRYYCQSYNYGTFAGSVANFGKFYSVIQSGLSLSTIPGIILFPLEMRLAPLAANVITYSDTSGASGKLRDATAAADITVSTVGPGSTGIDTITLSATNTAGHVISGHYTASSEL